MSKRGLRIAALVLSGGVLLQLAGCASLLVDQVIGTVVGTLISALIQSILSAATTAA